MNFNRLLITGATGFIGRHLITKLSLRKLIPNIRILVRESSNKKLISEYEKLIPGLEVVIGNLGNKESLDEALKDCDCLINLAACVTYKNIPDLYKINVLGVEKLCKSAIKYELKRFIQISSTASLGYSRDINDILDENAEFGLVGKGYNYAESKYLGDKKVLEYYKKEGLQGIICLPSEVYGEYGWETAKNLVDFLKFPVCWDGGTSVVYVKDVADGIIKALFNGVAGEKYILGSENLTIYQIVEYVLRFCDQNKKTTKIPNFIVNYPINFISNIQFKLGLEPLFDPDVIKYATKYWFVDSTKARESLNFKPSSNQIIFSKTINWLKENNLI
ncbi:MAG: NAD-dependent epimerase/dehydratase family protein [Candidatus Dadabacteria bacterium]|nr:NAD-dependent epimerase/dehydratase family protein [Candidatus Dadabacteria bacterium]NIQ16212.1 NAD-dependent epimerase/dehydratase family protein [Candidatus Dadabacteria bacterium]